MNETNELSFERFVRLSPVEFIVVGSGFEDMEDNACSIVGVKRGRNQEDTRFRSLEVIHARRFNVGKVVTVIFEGAPDVTAEDHEFVDGITELEITVTNNGTHKEKKQPTQIS